MNIRRENERLAIRIRHILIKSCPSFLFEGPSSVEWHGCYCEALGDSCICVWHLTSECPAGKWPQLSFVDDYFAKKSKKQAEMLSEAKQAIKRAIQKSHIS
jgi:hypothetical protein